MQEIEPPSSTTLRPLSVFTPFSVLLNGLPIFCFLSFHRSTVSSSSFPLSSPCPSFLRGKPSPGRGYSVFPCGLTLANSAHVRGRSGKFMCGYTGDSCTKKLDVRVARTYGKVCLWSTVGLCKSVRYLDTARGCVKGGHTHTLDSLLFPTSPSVFSPLPKPPLANGWTRHWRSWSKRGWTFFRFVALPFHFDGPHLIEWIKVFC